MDLLQEVGEQQFPSVLEALKKNWPQHFLPFQMFTILNRFTKADCEFQFKLYLYGSVETGVYLQLITVPTSERPMNLCYIYAPSKDVDAVEKVLQSTSRIPWMKEPFFILEMIPSVLRHVIEKALVARQIKALTKPNYVFIYPDEAHLVLPTVPDDVYLDFLNESHYKVVSQNWPNVFPGSDILHKEFITKNFGLGIFSKSNDEMLSFGVCNYTGGIFNLFTHPTSRGRGYATIIILHMTEEIRKRGMQPFCTVDLNNPASLSVFRKLGFEQFDTVDYYRIDQVLPFTN